MFTVQTEKYFIMFGVIPSYIHSFIQYDFLENYEQWLCIDDKIFKGDFLGHFLCFTSYIQHCFICRSDSIVPTDAEIELRTVATGAWAVRRSNH